MRRFGTWPGWMRSFVFALRRLAVDLGDHVELVADHRRRLRLRLLRRLGQRHAEVDDADGVGRCLFRERHAARHALLHARHRADGPVLHLRIARPSAELDLLAVRARTPRQELRQLALDVRQAIARRVRLLGDHGLQAVGRTEHAFDRWRQRR
jgi:hypothetical protein